jgi:hypothetical protein
MSAVAFLMAAAKILGFGFRPFLGVTVFFLQFADQLVFLAGDFVNFVIRDIAPLLTDLSFELLPLTLHRVPIHNIVSEKVSEPWGVGVATTE